MTLHTIGGVLRSLPWSVIVYQTEMALVAVIAFQWGRRKGWNERAEVWKQRADELQFKLVQCEERLAAERRITKRQDVIISQFSREGGERLRLVEGGGK